ncbi:MAG: aminotransferase class IV [Lachnospiraceae bacterium]|nr:aminotransferase class IV [Lachnospiraceae bacterium]
MENLGYYNGTFGPIEEIMIPMNDRVHFFGDGVYDATCSRNHVIYLIDEHIDRFFNSAGLLKIKLPYTKAELKSILQEMVEKVDGKDLFVYWQATRGTAPRNHAFPDVEPNLWITITPMTFRDLKERVTLTSAEDTRFLHCNIKTLNLLPSVMAAEKAKQENCFESVFHRGDIVTECAHSNVSILKDGVLKTHPNDHFILPGVAKAHLIMACKKLQIPVDETPYTLDELRAADEIIVTSSSNFCLVANTFEGKPVGGKAPELVDSIQEVLMKEFTDYCGE